MKTSNEAFWWSLFSAGGVLAALFLPAFILVTGFILPFVGADSADRFKDVRGLIAWWPVRALVIVVLSLSFFHCAHRIRHIVMDVGVRSLSTPLAVVCYAGAIAGVIATIFLVARL